MLSGPLGGDAQIASRMVEGKVDMIIFFRDPLGKHPHEVDVSMLMRLCDVHNIPLATNPAAASRFVLSLKEDFPGLPE
jgi:methylglyoxal synthase